MPQLDKFIFLSQLLWLVLLLGGGYLLLVKQVLPSTLQTLKFRRLLLRDPLTNRSLVEPDSTPLPSLQPPLSASAPLLFPAALLALGGSGGLLVPTHQLSTARRWNLLLRLQLEGGFLDLLPVWAAVRIGMFGSLTPPLRSGRFSSGWVDSTPLLPVAGLRGTDRLVERTLPI